MTQTLPDVGKATIDIPYFPTKMQAFIFRNWEMVSKEKIAAVLETTVENVEVEAMRMGLGAQGDTQIWMEKGYITILRSNWHLLPYEQILTLLDWSADKLAHILKEEDFLDVKFGMFKPDCEKVVYRPLTAQEIAKTDLVRTSLSAVSVPEGAKAPFDFWSKSETSVLRTEPKAGQVIIDGSWSVKNATGDAVVDKMAARFKDKLQVRYGVCLSGNEKTICLNYVKHDKEEYHKICICDTMIEIEAGGSAGILRGLYRLLDWMHENGGPYLERGAFERVPRFGARYIYSFCSLYEGAFDVDSATYCPDSLLEQYAETGVNGIWLQAVLYRMTEFPFDKSMSVGWDKRQENLRNFVNRAKEYGIKIYLYINEPRTMPLTFFEQYPDMKGAVCGKYACMCFSSQQTCDYLSGAVESLCRAVPGLGGFFTITMSENLTHCKAREVDVPCARCADKTPLELAAQANRLIAEGAHRADPNVLVIAWDWAWERDNDDYADQVQNCIESLPKSIALMSKRETSLAFERGGISGTVQDYAMSVEGMSAHSVKQWEIAKAAGLETAVKLQINNSWECSTVPYLPVYGMLTKQMDDLIAIGMDHLMLSWTLGGYPSPSIKLISEAFFSENEEAPDYDKSLRIMYGDRAETVKEATEIFCQAFREFPFHIHVLYLGPQNAGVSNLLYVTPTGYKATMTCYAYDDLERWRGIYPVDVFENQFGLVAKRWKDGLAVLGEQRDELWDMAYVSYTLFASSYNQIRFIRLRDAYASQPSAEIKSELCAILRDEREMAMQVYEIMCLRPSVGFEAANHYYFSTQMVLEKIVNCDWLLKYYA